MRIARVALVCLSLVAGGCAERVTHTLIPWAEARESLTQEAFWGRMVLDDGRSLAFGEAHLLGDWVCGKIRYRRGAFDTPRGDVCIPAARIAALETEKRQMGAGTAVGTGLYLLVISPLILIWAKSEHDSDRRSREAAEESAARRRVAEAEADRRGETLPPLPTAEDHRRRSAFFSLANCSGVRSDARDQTDGDTLAAEVWRERRECIEPAQAWYAAAGQIDRARRLTFIVSARSRYEALACGGRWDPSLSAPKPELIGSAGGSWLAEYRAVVSDPRTYDYAPKATCYPMGGSGEIHITDAAFSAAQSRMRSEFPLTDPAILAAALEPPTPSTDPAA
jgi:hypothetical protein